MPKNKENSLLTNIYQDVKGIFVTIDYYFPLSFRDGITYGYLLSMADSIPPLMAISGWELKKLGLGNDHDACHTALIVSFGSAMPLLLKNSNDAIPAIAGEVVSFLFYNALQEYLPQYFKVENKFYAALSIAASTIWYFRSEIYSDYDSLFSSNEPVEVAGAEADNAALDQNI